MYSLDLLDLYSLLKKTSSTDNVINEVIHNILLSLSTFIDSNIEYLDLNRSIPSLSGGELQRLRLSTLLHSKISNILYILDEPSSSIYYKELPQLFEQIKKLKNQGNTILLIEHNEDFIDNSDNKILLGPGSGINGGEIVHEHPKEVFFERNKIQNHTYIELKKLSLNNIQNEDIKYPIKSLIGISGPSGSGKSSFAKALNKRLSNSIYISQKPITGNVNSIVCSYIGILDLIKAEFVKPLKEITKNSISYTHEDGACENCMGKGYVYISIPFGDKIKNICSRCNGKRYNTKALTYIYNNLTILELLQTSIEKLIKLNIFNSKKVIEKLIFLESLGLGYLNLFQETSTLSGGESQRLKLVKYLHHKKSDLTYIIDEPFCGVDKLNICKAITLFDKIIKKDSTIFFIEHNTFALSQCDFIIEIGPGKGKNGGKVVKSDFNNPFSTN